MLAAEGNRILTSNYVFAYRPIRSLENLIDADLLQASRAARRSNTGWPIGLLPEGFRNSYDRYEGVEEGLRVVIGQHEHYRNHFDYWILTRSGAFYLLRNLDDELSRWGNQPPNSYLTSSTVVWRVAEALDHCIALYRALGVSGDEQIIFEAQYNGLAGRYVRDDEARIFQKGPSLRDTAQFSLTASLDQLVADADGIVYDAVRTLLSNFRFFDVPKEYVSSVIREYRASDI